MQSPWMPILVAAALSACGGDDGRPVVIPEVPAGAHEADCQTLCTLADGETTCTEQHASFCLASCRAQTSGLAPTCAACLIAGGTPIAGGLDGFDEPYCSTGGPIGLAACPDECDDGGADAAAAPAVLCELACAFYMEDPEPLACSADGSAECRAECAAAIAAHGRLCGQCLVDQTLPARTCFNDDCDCSPFFDDDVSFGCETLCDDVI